MWNMIALYWINIQMVLPKFASIILRIIGNHEHIAHLKNNELVSALGHAEFKITVCVHSIDSAICT